jgi:hypothetical protein
MSTAARPTSNKKNILPSVAPPNNRTNKNIFSFGLLQIKIRRLSNEAISAKILPVLRGWGDLIGIKKNYACGGNKKHFERRENCLKTISLSICEHTIKQRIKSVKKNKKGKE